MTTSFQKSMLTNRVESHQCAPKGASCSLSFPFVILTVSSGCNTAQINMRSSNFWCTTVTIWLSKTVGVPL